MKTDRTSRYDAETNICWQFRNKGDRHWRCKCPVCTGPHRERDLLLFGRCRSGCRWFWTAVNFTLSYCNGRDEEIGEHGWEDSEEHVVASARAAVVRLAGGRRAAATFDQGQASRKLKELNKAKRLQRPPPDGTDSRPVEYLYGYSGGGEDTPGHPVRFQIVKKTAKRIYYLLVEQEIDRHGEPIGEPWSARYSEDAVGFVDRQKLEVDGHVYNRGRHWCYPDFHLHVSLESVLGDRGRRDEPLDLAQLKAEMAASHPDRGGTSAAFIAARQRYVAARRQQRSASRHE
jgi:hypothetical protein